MHNFARAGVIIEKNGSFLFMKRTKQGRVYYAVLGGRPENNETPEETAIREIQEETGLVVTLKPNPLISDSGMKSSFYTTPEYFFWADTVEGRPELGGPEKEISRPDNQFELAWITKKDLPTIILLPHEIHEYLISIIT